jgi:hypothetical protein
MMRNARHSLAVLTVAAMLIASAIGSTLACNYDGISTAAIAARYPRAVEVLAALRNAANAPVLDRQLVAPTFVNMMGYHRAVRRLQRLRDSLERAALDRKPSGAAFSLLLVEAGLWTRYLPDSEGVSIAVHAPGPQATDTVVFTGEAVIEAIGSGRLSPDEALRRGLIVIEGPAAAVRDLWPQLRAALALLAEQS